MKKNDPGSRSSDRGSGIAKDAEHAPTAAQCQADSALWQSQAADFFRAGNPHDTNNTVIAKMTARQLQKKPGRTSWETV